MNKFFSKLEKLDFLAIIYVVIVCLFALVVMHGWPKGNWALDWTALAAVSTFLAAIIALGMGVKSIKSQNEVRLATVNDLAPRVLKKIRSAKYSTLAVTQLLGNAVNEKWDPLSGISKKDYRIISLAQVKTVVGRAQKEISELQFFDYSSFGILDKSLPGALAYLSLDGRSSFEFIAKGLSGYARELTYEEGVGIAEILANEAQKIYEELEQLEGRIKRVAVSL